MLQQIQKPANIPRLPLEVIGLVAHQLSTLGYYGTLANLNITCHHVRLETIPALWTRVVVKRIDSVATSGWITTFSPEQCLELFKARYGGEKYYKYIKYVIDEHSLLRSDSDHAHGSASTHVTNPFRSATIIGASLQSTKGILCSTSSTSCSVRLGQKHQYFTDELANTLHAQHKLPTATLWESIDSRSSVKLHLTVLECFKTTLVASMSPDRIKHLLDCSSLGWFPSGRINEVHILPEATDRNSAVYDAGYLQGLVLDMLNLLAVSAGKHVLLGSDSKCAAPSLYLNGLTLEEVDVVIKTWFTVLEHMPIYAGIKLVLALRNGPSIPLDTITQQLRNHKASYLRYIAIQDEYPTLKIKLLDVSRRTIAILGKPLHQYRSEAAGLCVYDPNATRMRWKCAVFEQWNGEELVETDESGDEEMGGKVYE